MLDGLCGPTRLTVFQSINLQMVIQRNHFFFSIWVNVTLTINVILWIGFVDQAMVVWTQDNKIVGVVIVGCSEIVNVMNLGQIA